VALAAVRAATSARHAALDAGLPIGREGAGLPDVVAHLAMLRDWLVPMVAWLERDADASPGFARLRGGLADVRHDIAALQGKGIDVPAPRPAPAARTRRTTPAFHWGVAYVIAGSSLGGRLLARRLAPVLAGLPLRMFRDDASVAAGWREFLQAFESAVRGPAAIEAACEGARMAFDRLLALAPCSAHGETA
jgi:heme oxygenase